MNLLERTISKITIPVTDLSAEIDRAMTSQDGVDFGRLNDVLFRYISITGERHPAPPQTSVVISCADHGVAAESVSAYPPETTLNMMCNYLIACSERCRKLCKRKPYRCRSWREYGTHRHPRTSTPQHCTRNGKHDQRTCHDTRTGDTIH